ncbi:dipeptide/oligopeptide/nickel ABC transporter permease/ATP-binding protein [Cryptosporangium sp. NPDC051539]|uniref:dipeptide/oligopeptide/nickel ABC transporter permease/ATP-binding protein n=1 Tax=Cryptosporangium sp. NPDC051539 TaxID=3363962 RepID=UPI0037AEDE06
MRWLRVVRTPLGLTATVLMAVVLVAAALGPVVWGTGADAVDTDRILAAPSGAHWAGTDSLGRDILLRVLVASRLSIVLALLATVLAVGAGLVLGALPFLLGRRSGRIVTAAVNIAVAFPGILLALFFAVVFGVGATGAVLAIGLAGAPSFARLTQTLVAEVAARDYVSAARTVGLGRGRILVRHVLPNVAEPLVVNATIGAGGALLSFAGLSFLGLGVQPPAYDWGRLLYDGIGTIYVNAAAALAPGAAVVLAGLAFNFFGESVAKGLGVTVDVGLRPVVRARVRTEGRPAEPDADVVLDVRDLEVTLAGPAGPIRPVRGISFQVRRGEAVGIVGESGSGKSMTALAVTRLIADHGQVDATRLTLLDQDLLAPDTAARRRTLGTRVAMVFQDPMTAFNPTRRIGAQLAEAATHHQKLSRREAMARAADRLDAVRIPDARTRVRQYPHEFSGGMRQRAMIGMGLMNTPALIVADEPTTALDVTVQRQVLELLATIRRSDRAALVLISHDVAVIGDVCDRVLVMYAGRIVEELPADAKPLHPYTRALMDAVPDMATDLDRPLATIPGRPVDPADVPPGCAYAERCPLADDHCRAEDPPLAADSPEHRVACWHAGEEPR